ncbi:MAG: DUF1919 domain-containing protein [Candidatus Homeothermus sp.]|jgi:uncharacterized protein HI_1244|nr:DUF1919 domain-containing protein [Candidatus Homeothermus sp.]
MIRIQSIKKRICKKNRELQLSYANRNLDKNISRSVICNNCVGAMVLHDFGLCFNSPFVNLYITAPEYIKLLSNIEYYCSPTASIRDITESAHYPKGLLQNEITLHFLHYDTFEEAEKKWRKRCERIDYNNLYVILVQQSSCNDNLINKFDKFTFKKSIALVNHLIPGINKQFTIPGWENAVTLGAITEYSDISGKRYYDSFDWRKFLDL